MSYYLFYEDDTETSEIESSLYGTRTLERESLRGFLLHFSVAIVTKRFRRFNHRSNPEMVHRGIKEFQCTLCPKMFMQKESRRGPPDKYAGMESSKDP